MNHMFYASPEIPPVNKDYSRSWYVEDETTVENSVFQNFY